MSREAHGSGPGEDQGVLRRMGPGWRTVLLLMAPASLVGLGSRAGRRGETHKAHCLRLLACTSPAMLELIVSPRTWNAQPRVSGGGGLTVPLPLLGAWGLGAWTESNSQDLHPGAVGQGGQRRPRHITVPGFGGFPGLKERVRGGARGTAFIWGRRNCIPGAQI